MAAENKPEGLKKIRNPERMVRIAVGYTGHAPPKSDDTDANNEPGQLKIYLPKKLLECLPKCSSLPKERHRWNTNEEIAAYLITFEKHDEWLTTSPKTRPQNGSMILYNRKKVKYRKDGYCWKKRKDGKTTREDHMKLKVQGVECLYGCYVHSSIIPTFHRRCYWLLQNPDIVLVHYLNVPAVDDSGKPCGPVLCSINTDRKEWAKWSKEELIGQLKPMCAGSSLHQKCSSVKQRIISSKQEPGATAGGGPAVGTGVAAGQRAEEADGTEVQNSDVSEGQTEPSPGGGRSRGAGGGERRNGRITKPSLLPQSSMEVSSSTSTNQVEVPDTTQSSPLSITSDMADSPALAIGAGLTQSTAVFMSEVTTLTGDSVYSTGHTHLLASTHDSATAGILLAVTPENQTRFTSFSGGVGLGEGGELVLSSSLDSSGGVSLPETTMTFDPDCFLNNPKQGQTYGGGGGKTEGCNGDDGGLHCSSNGFVYNSALVNNIKTETTPLEQPLTTQSSYVGEGTGLSPSTTLEQMDFSAVMSSACVPSLTQTTHRPSPSLFLQTSPQTSQPSQLQTNGAETTQESGESQAYISLPTVPKDSPVTNGDLHTQLHQTSSDQPGLCGRSGQGAAVSSFPLNPQDTVVDQSGNRRHREVGVLDKTSENGGELLLKPGDPHEAYTSVDTEQYLQASDENGGREEGAGGGGAGGGGGGGGGENEILCNGVSLSGASSSVVTSPQSIATGTSIDGALYSSSLPQQGGGVSTGAAGAGAAISLEGFEASFGSQFSDLINDFISVEGSAGGVGAAVTGVLMPQEGTVGGEEQGTGPGHLQGSELEQGALGLLQETGRLFGVTDYSPEWSYPEGGVKVLITGPWLESSSEYSCLFDHISVPAALIQPGVLRCYCPAHDTGLVMLQVAMGGEVISSSVVFEYKARDLPALPSSQHDWLSLDDTQFRMSILERLEQMEQRMAEISTQNPSSETMANKGGGVEGGGTTDQQSQISPDQGSFEGRVVVVCEKMMSQPCWASSNQLVHSKNSRGMTLLHLAAAQGYAGLIQTLIRWRTKHADSIDLELEVDPLNVDHFSCTPLMWACALGHTEAALVLYQWDPRALAIPDSLGRLPLNIARSRGHTRLAELLEQLQQTPHAQGQSANTWIEKWRGESQTSGISNSPTANSKPELRRARPESQPDNQNQSWSQTGHRTQGEQGGPPPAKRLKPNPDTQQQQQQLANSTTGANTLTSLLNSSSSPHPLRSVPTNTLPTQPYNLSCQNTPPVGSSPDRSQLPRAPFSHLQARIGRSGGATRWSLRQAVGQRSLARRILGKERLAIHLRQRVLCDRGEETELLTFQDNTEDLQMDITMLADHIMETSAGRLKQEAMETETDSSVKVGVSSDVRLLSGYLDEVEKFLNSKPQNPGPKANSFSGPEDQQSPPAKRALSSPFDWSSFLCAAMKEERLKSDSTRLGMTEAEQGELYETIRHALHSLRKHKSPLQEQRKEIAAVIQRCYRRYKQYALYKRMTLAAILIQSRFRSFHEQRKFQQSRRAAVLIQQYYRSYRHSLSSLLTKKQNQAARKILRFLLRCRHSPLMDHRPLKQGQRAEKGQGS